MYIVQTVVRFLNQCQLQLFVGGLISYLRYLCLLAYSGIQHILCCVVCFARPRLVSSVPNVASFCGMSILDCPFGLSNVYFTFTILVEEQKSLLSFITKTNFPFVSKFMICCKYQSLVLISSMMPMRMNNQGDNKYHIT